MSVRRIFLDTCAGIRTDRPFLWESGFWAGAVDRWRREGLPADADPFEFLGLDRIAITGVDSTPIPSFTERVVEDEGESELIEYESGQLVRRYKYLFHPGNPEEHLVHELKWPVRDRESWAFVKKRLDPFTPQRIEGLYAFMEGRREERMERSGFSGAFDDDAGLPTAFYLLSPTYWLIRNLMGFEQTAILLYEDPELLEEMYEYCTWFIEEQLKVAFKQRVPDAVFLNEEAANKAGPYMSPAMYRRLAAPRLSRLVNLCRGAGVPHVIVHSSGNIRQLIPIWLEIEVNGFIPVDASAGMDPVAIRLEYPKALLIGGANRTILETDMERIEAEVMSKVPALFAGGRYIPSGNAHFPITDRVSLDNMKYYVDALRRAWEVEQ